MTANDHYDVVIIGAGMVGSALACALARAPECRDKRLLLVEASALRSDAPPAQPGYDSRSTVLSAGSVDCFQHLGLWDEALARSAPIHDIHISDQGRLGSVRLNAREEGVAALGYVVENSVLGASLNRALQHPGLTLRAPARVTALQPVPGGMRVLIDDLPCGAEAQTATEPSALSASLVVMAEGGRSGLCPALGIHHEKRDYGQSAVIANLGFARPHQGVAFERFTPKGPLALLPLSPLAGEQRAALIWTHARHDAEAIMALDDATFLARIQQDFGMRLGRFLKVGKRACFPLSLQLASEQIRPHLVLLGNVAHSLHPVAGQGFNLALRDSMLLADNILASLRQGLAPGSITRLQAYQQAAALDQQLTVAFSDYMTRLFSSEATLLSWLRKAGMASVDLLPPLKSGLSRQAMGMAHARVRPGAP